MWICCWCIGDATSGANMKHLNVFLLQGEAEFDLPWPQTRQCLWLNSSLPSGSLRWPFYKDFHWLLMCHGSYTNWLKSFSASWHFWNLRCEDLVFVMWWKEVFWICKYLRMAGMSGSRPDAVVGTREFSRVRQYDMEERRRRILGNPKYKIAVLFLLPPMVFFSDAPFLFQHLVLDHSLTF